MTTAPLVGDDGELRKELDRSVTKLRLVLDGCPGLPEIQFGTPRAATLLSEAHIALHQAQAVAKSLEGLAAVSEQAAILASASRIALGVVAEVLTLLSAEIDGWDDAA
jgi:hypothetical protein